MKNLGGKIVFLRLRTQLSFARWNLSRRFLASNSSETSKKQTHFGYQTVDEEEKSKKVYDVFENVASRYDLMNDVMSFGVHRLWKDQFVRRLYPTSNIQLLDVAGGTGDIAFRVLRHIDYKLRRNETTRFSKPDSSNLPTMDLDPYSATSSLLPHKPVGPDDQPGSTATSEDRSTLQCEVTVCDINQAMLDVGQQKASEMGYGERISWVRGDAEALPFPNDKFDAYTIAFGIRNCTHIDKVLQEARRVLRPGGRFMCLEFSDLRVPVIRSFYDWYSFQVIPVMGQIFAADWNSYQYLVESIRQFPKQEEFAAMIRESGFQAVTYENLSCGIVATHSGFKI